MPLSEIVLNLFIVVFFAFFGISFLLGKSTRVGIGGGRTGGSPLFRIELKGVIAKLLGAILVVSSLLIVVATILNIFGDYSDSSIISLLPFIAVVVVVLSGFLVSAIQASIEVVGKARTIQERFNGQDKDTPDDP